MKKYQLQGQGMRSNQGSALITAIIFSFIVGVLSVTYLKLASNEYRVAVRSTMYSSTLNLAESGVEMGIQALSAGTVSGTSPVAITADDYLVDEAFTGDVTCVIFDPQDSSPTIYAEGVISGHPQGDVVKQVRVTLQTGFTPFENGFSAVNGVTFVGRNVYLDSYNSNYGPYNVTDILTVPRDYGVVGSYTNRSDNIVVASDSINSEESEESISVGNAIVVGNGNVSEGDTINIGPRGSIEDINGNTQTTRDDFYADFPIQYSTHTPTVNLGNVNSYEVIIGSTDPLNPVVADASAISLNGSGKNFVVIGHVELQMDGDIAVGTGIYLSEGAASLPADVYSGLSSTAAARVASMAATGSSMAIYTDHDVKISGNGVSNPSGKPENFMIYGTAAGATDGSGNSIASQEIKIAGNGQLYSTVYAPNADVELKGGGNSGEVMGGVVGFTAVVTGNSNFHFDEALLDIEFGGGVYTITSWLEMNRETAASTPIDLSVY